MEEVKLLQEKYNAIKAEKMSNYVDDRLVDLELEFKSIIRSILDASGVSYNESYTESIYIDIFDYWLDENEGDFETKQIRISTHDNNYTDRINYVENDFEDMINRIKQILKCQTGLFCWLDQEVTK